MWELAALALVCSTVLPAAELEREEIVVEGTISLGWCGLLPPVPVCVVRADSDGKQYALLDTDGNGEFTLADTVTCLNTFLLECRQRVRVQGSLEWLYCDPVEPIGMNGIWPQAISAIDDGPPCGDVTGNRSVDVSDPIAILNHLFSADGPYLCPGVSDGNGDGKLDISDAIFLLSYLFLGGPAPRCS